MKLIFDMIVLGLTTGTVLAYPGGLNAEGCHNNRKTGEYHCHRSAARQSFSQTLQALLGAGAAFRNCTQARAAGVAPIRVDGPGYSSHLDRDGDGIACG